MTIDFKGKIITIRDDIAELYEKMNSTITADHIEYALTAGEINIDSPSVDAEIEKFFIDEMQVGVEIGEAINSGKLDGIK